MDHKEGEGVLINSRSTLRMRVKRAEICWTEVNFEAKSQTNSIFISWASKLMVNFDYSKKISQTGIRKALNLSNSFVSIGALRT